MKTIEQFSILTKLTDTADGGAECIELARKGLEPETGERGYTYALVFMDLSMKLMDGYQATESLRLLYQEGNQPWIVACSGHVEPTFIQKAWRHGIDEFAPKPLQTTLLERILASIYK